MLIISGLLLNLRPVSHHASTLRFFLGGGGGAGGGPIFYTFSSLNCLVYKCLAWFVTWVTSTKQNLLSLTLFFTAIAMIRLGRGNRIDRGNQCRKG